MIKLHGQKDGIFEYSFIRMPEGKKEINLFFLHTQCQSWGPWAEQSSASLPPQGDLSNLSIPHLPRTDTRTPEGQNKGREFMNTVGKSLTEHILYEGKNVPWCAWTQPTLPGYRESVSPVLFSSRTLYLPLESSIQQHPTTLVSTINLTTKKRLIKLKMFSVTSTHQLFC